jgi:hypothetical protein
MDAVVTTSGVPVVVGAVLGGAPVVVGAVVGVVCGAGVGDPDVSSPAVFFLQPVNNTEKSSNVTNTTLIFIEIPPMEIF